jgi:tRNA 2-thiocytidine biosynthesis protein TtcA
LPDCSTKVFGEKNMQQMISYRTLIRGDMPPWVHRFIKLTGKGINSYGMIAEGERILLGISGGKDSLALALALSLRRKWLPINYELEALHINWIEHPVARENIEQMRTFFDELDIRFTSVDAHMFHEQYEQDFNCYHCSRNRRRILFDHAAERGIRQIALGHHLDDLVETSLMNLFFRADFSTMLPVQEFFDHALYVIRPMTLVKEHTIIRLAQQYDLPVVKPVCPYDQTNIRSTIKPLVSQLSRMDKLVREHIYKAHHLNCRIVRSDTQHHRGSPEPDPQESE